MSSADSADAREVARLFRIVKTLRQMLVDRGYVVCDSDLNVTLEEFTLAHASAGKIDRSQLYVSALKPNGEDHIMVGFFAGEERKKIGVAPVRSFCQKLAALGVHRGIIVHKQPLSPQTHKVLSLIGDKYKLEAFLEIELIVNITKHSLVPKHVLLAPEEKKSLLERYRLKDSQLPRILITDPVARYLGLRRSDVVKIIRNSETAGRYITYRLCM